VEWIPLADTCWRGQNPMRVVGTVERKLHPPGGGQLVALCRGAKVHERSVDFGFLNLRQI